MGAATTYDEWIAALDLAIMWDFKEVSLPEKKTIIGLYIFSLYISLFSGQGSKDVYRSSLRTHQIKNRLRNHTSC